MKKFLHSLAPLSPYRPRCIAHRPVSSTVRGTSEHRKDTLGKECNKKKQRKKNASKRKQHSETRALGESVSAVPRSPFGKTRLHEFYQNILSTACSRPRLGAAFLSPESMRGYFHKVFRKCYLPATIAKRAKGSCRFYTGRTLGRWRFAHFFWT